MATKRTEELNTKLTEASNSYAQLTTRLSERILAFETRLKNLPGKAHVCVEGERGKFLSFERSGDQWGLTYADFSLDSPPQWLSRQSVEAKIEAVPLMEPLLRAFVKAIETRHERVELAVDKMDELFDRLDSVGTEGE